MQSATLRGMSAPRNGMIAAFRQVEVKARCGGGTRSPSSELGQATSVTVRLMAPAASTERNRTCRNVFRPPSARLAFHLQGRPIDRPTSPLRLISASRLSARCLAGVPTSRVPAVASVATGSRMNSSIRIMKWTERPAKSSSGLLVLTVESS